MAKEINSFKDEYRWLSNFWPANVSFEGDKYSSVEHAYQAAKFPREQRDDFQDPMCSASAAKAMGRRSGVRPDWETVRLDVMRVLLNQKFDPALNPWLAKDLITTGNAELIEGNWWGDSFWGVCRGKGQNHLGKMLMAIRAELVSRGV